MQIYELVVNKVVEFFGNFVKYGCDLLKQIDWYINSFSSNLVISNYVGGFTLKATILIYTDLCMYLFKSHTCFCPSCP